jgi:hypothetical protein
MFRTCAFVIGAAAALSASPASAGVLYNTLHSPAVGQISGTGIGNFGPLAVSFDVPTATTITDIQVLMNTASHDNGTVLIYLVPDDGSGGAGKAGLPLGGASFATAPGAMLVGSVSDNSLVLNASGSPGQAAGTVDFSIAQSVTAGEWWVGFTDVGGSARVNFDLGYTPDSGNSVGTAFQEDYTQQPGGLGSYLVNTVFNPPIVGTAGARAFEISVSANAPEPASLGILGAGLALLGLARRRRT